MILALLFPMRKKKQKVINITSDKFSIIFSENIPTRDFVEAKVIKETSGLATNENLAKLEKKMDEKFDKIEDKMDRLLMWFVGSMLAMLAVLIPLILTLR